MMGAAELRGAVNSDVLGQLLHALCQPLTTLRCSLEVSLDDFNDRQCESVSVALEQTDRAIETVELMRECLELERGISPAGCVEVMPAVRVVMEQLSVVAEAHGIPLLASGTTAAVLRVNEYWLQRGLRYLIGSLIETQAPGNAVTVLLEDRTSYSLLSAHSLARGQFTGSQAEHSRAATFVKRDLRLRSGCSNRQGPGSTGMRENMQASSFACPGPRGKFAKCLRKTKCSKLCL
jgi:hypothetical protein